MKVKFNSVLLIIIFLCIASLIGIWVTEIDYEELKTDIKYSPEYYNEHPQEYEIMKYYEKIQERRDEYFNRIP